MKPFAQAWSGVFHCLDGKKALFGWELERTMEDWGWAEERGSQ